MDNIGVYDKIMRGIYAASFSLLCDAAAYPVINSSVFYLDDFPSPVPGGDGTYIRRDYRMSIADFYSKVWWPDLVKLAQQYSIRFTGVMIENYEDDTQSTPVRQPDTCLLYTSREDELPLLCRAVYQQGFLQRNNRLLTLVICHKDIFVYFLVYSQLFKCLFPQAPACKAIGRVE